MGRWEMEEGREGQTCAVLGRQRSASCPRCSDDGVTVKDRVCLPLAFSTPCIHLRFSCLTSCFISKEQRVTFWLVRTCIFAQQHLLGTGTYVFSQLFLLLKRRGKREREREGAKIGRKLWKKMSLTDLFSSGCLSSCFLNLSEKLRPCPHKE